MVRDEARERRITNAYNKLNGIDLDTWRRCVEHASTLQIRCGLTCEQAAEVEASLVDLALSLIGPGI